MQIRRNSRIRPLSVSPQERSYFYVFEPGDSTRYKIMITSLDSKEAQGAVVGVNSDFRLVTILNGFSAVASYPICFNTPITHEGNVGYLSNKFGINEATAKMLANMLEYIRTHEESGVDPDDPDEDELYE